MDLETVSPEGLGVSLRGLGLNLLVRDVPAEVAFLTGVFGMQSYRVTTDFAIMTYHDQLFQLHADHTYHSHPLPSLLPEAGARGGGLEIRLYETDPDQAVANAAELDAHILQSPEDKPHGLRETCILCENGYAWIASRPL